MHETATLISIGFCVVSALLIVVWMGAFEYTAFQLEHRFPKYYQSIGDPRLSKDFGKGVIYTYRFLSRLLRNNPNGFPNDKKCVRSSRLFRFSFRMFLLAAAVAATFGILSAIPS